MEILPIYKKEMEQELHNILDYWKNNIVDYKAGGFFGKVDNENRVDFDAPKGVVLQSRILWAFSAAYNLTKNEDYVTNANHVFNFIKSYFIDVEFGGVYWSVSAFGFPPVDTKKQIYGLAFCMYGLAEYYKINENKEVQNLAIELFNTIEKFSFDEKNKGYLEAFTRDWQPIDDLRLSEKDDNEKKTMNTHLHVIEGYANLYTIWPNDKLKLRIIDLLEVFDKYIINNNHLNLFMNEDWLVKGSTISYGHDIEAAWLLLESAEIINHDFYITMYKKHCLNLVNGATEGLASDGGLWYEFEPATNHLVKQKHSWPQAEAMVGFFQAYQITQNEKYLQQSVNSWNFCKKVFKRLYVWRMVLGC